MVNKIGIIYVATDTARDDLQYVGQTMRSLKIRKSKNYNPYFQNAITDHGEAITWEEFGPYPIEQLDLIERCFIYGLNTMYPNGYNFDTGGHFNKQHSPATRAKISKSNTGKKRSVEICRKFSLSHLGKTQSAETKLKRSLAMQGNKNPNYRKSFSKETRQKMSDSHLGRRHTEEVKKKIAERRGILHHQFGKPQLEVTKQKISQSIKAYFLLRKTKLNQEVGNGD